MTSRGPRSSETAATETAASEMSAHAVPARDKPSHHAPPQITQRAADQPLSIPGLRIGTSAFTAAGWSGSFYPPELKPKDYLPFYATKFSSVEIDSTYYATPSPTTVRGWRDKTPDGFLFSAKVPQVVTHDKVLLDCDPEFSEFLGAMKLLGEKLGPILLQFPYFNEADMPASVFIGRLLAFLERLKVRLKGGFNGEAVRFAVEIRNNTWLNQEFAGLLREHNVALVLQDQGWMRRPHELAFDYLTADFTYVRLLGDRKGIERQTKTWDKVVVDRSTELRTWVDLCHATVRGGVPTFVYVNNHYAGHAPATVAQFLQFWNATMTGGNED
jgi:uncharacterized protein YecE (DUF72 family)